MQVLAIDQGTTATKALLVAGGGSNRVLGSLPHRQIHPAPGWVEQDAAELLRNVEMLLARGRDAGVGAWALANQGETVLAWDRATGRPLCNAIVWQDQRTAGRVNALREQGLEPQVSERAGLPLDAYFSGSKLRWILDEVPEARRLLRIGRLGLGTSDAWFIERLTGRYVTDVTTAARTSLMNLGLCQWDPDLCEMFGVPGEALPAIVECDETIGDAGGILLETALVDQIAALHGHGCAAPGDAKVTLGTGAFALTVTDGRSHLPGVVAALGWRGPAGRVHAADGGVYSAGAAVEWLVRLGLLGAPGDLDGLGGPPAAARGVFFVPALTGLACPHWDRSAAGLWIGLDVATGRDDLVKAVLEGVAFRVAEVLDALGAKAGGVLSIDGGLTRSRYFRDFLARALDRELFLPSNVEITALGAARLASRGAIPHRLAGTAIAPAPADPAWREQFAEARQRATGWRRPARA